MENIGCVPCDGDFIPQDPWEGRVPVIKNGRFSFRFNTGKGFVIWKVTTKAGGVEGDEIIPDNDGIYTIKNVTAATEICVYSVIPTFEVGGCSVEGIDFTIEGVAGLKEKSVGIGGNNSTIYEYDPHDSVDIKFQFQTDDDILSSIKENKKGFVSRVMIRMLAGRKDDNGDEIPFVFCIDDDGYVNIPFDDTNAFDPEYRRPIETMARYAASNREGVIKVDSIAFRDDHFRPARQLLLQNEDAVELEFDNEPYTSEVEGNDKFYYLKDDTQTLSFTATAREGYQLESVTYRPINWYEDEDGNLCYETASGYGGTTEIEPNGAGKYVISVKDPREDDPWVNLGIEISFNVTKLSTVIVELMNVESPKDPAADARLFNAGVRIDSRTYKVDPVDINDDPVKEKIVYRAYVPGNSTVTVNLSSKDDLWTISEVVPDDAGKASGKAQKANKNNEYTLTVGARDEVTLTAMIKPVTRLVITDEAGKELKAVKNAYTLKKAGVFKAYLASGSKIDPENSLLTIPKKEEGIEEFFNGTKKIDPTKYEDDKVTISEGVLTASGEALDLNKLSLKVTYERKSYTATLNFTNPPTKAVITSPKLDAEYAISVPYNQKATISVNIDGDLNGVEAWFCEITNIDYETQTFTINKKFNVAKFGSFDGKTIIIDPKKAKNYPEYYKPFAWQELCFLDDKENPIGEGFSVINSFRFTAPILHDKTAPVIKENAALSTNQAIGLSLTLPKGVKASDGMYYRIEADVEEYCKGREQTITINGQEQSYFDNLAFVNNHDTYETDDDEIVRVFREKAVVFVPATEKTWALDVTDNPRNPEDGWKIDYKVKASLVYAEECEDDQDPYYDNGYKVLIFNIDNTDKRQETPESAEVTMSTKDRTFETKLTLTKKLPAKVYNTQNSIPIAIPKWSKNASVQGLERVELINEYGNERGHWNRWNNNEDDDDTNDSFLLNVDEDGLITLDTTWMDDEGFECYLEAGKYTVVAYAIGGPGQNAMATVPVTILESIHSLLVTAPARVLKNYNKAAVAKTEVCYNVYWEGAPATKKVEWSVGRICMEEVDPGAEDGNVIPVYYNFDDSGYWEDKNNPLIGMVSVKNGSVEINKALLVDLAKYQPEDYQFVVCATAADYEGNMVTGYSDPVQITSDAQIPTEIQFVWDEYRWDDEHNKDILVNRFYSHINDEEIARREAAEKAKDKTMEPFYSNAIHNSKVIVLDQYGKPMYAELKLSGIKQNEEGRLILSKPGSVSITATSCDGGKKSKQLKFKIADGDARYIPNVLIQDSTRNVGDHFDSSFINIDELDDPNQAKGWDDCINNLPANRYIYVHVGAVRYSDIYADDKGYHINKWDKPNYGDNVMFNHTVKVKGGTIKETRTDMLNNYTTYVILPSEEDTVVTLTDNTVDKVFGREKGISEYLIHNSKIAQSKTKARTITADKAGILNWMYVRKGLFEFEIDGGGYITDYSANPNHVTYTIKDADKDPGSDDKGDRNYYALITMDDPETEAQRRISRFIGISSDMEEVEGIYKPVDNGQFSLDFFEEINNDQDGFYYCDFWEVPSGTYSFYVTYGYKYDDGEFTPLSPAVKMSVKTAAAPAPSVKFAASAFRIGEDENGDPVASIPLPTVTKGYGIVPFCELRNLNTGGVTNRFSDLFNIEMSDEHNDKPTMQDSMTLKPKPSEEVFSEESPDILIPVGTGKNIKTVRIGNWWELRMLKEGEFKISDGEQEVYEYVKNGPRPVDTSANQKKAYDSFVKANCTGYITVRTLGYDGRQRDVDTKITVNIDDFVAAQEEPEP
ncbi:MAG: hypothetical protein K5886_12980 [Lachnospiraceae bacterium]|nr:hypothetical protein [Lachnospiraceae bacterium]